MTTMIRTTLIERLLVIFLVLGVGLYELFHAIFDGLQYMANVKFVGTVLSMEATRNPDAWQAIDSPVVAFIGYTLIWVAHAASGILCLFGSYVLASSISSDDATYRESAAIATLGVGIGCILYLVGFLAIASGWFRLYQAPTPPNYIPNAQMLFLCYVAVLIYLVLIRR
jgi:predicted small integral membrane protein